MALDFPDWSSAFQMISSTIFKAKVAYVQNGVAFTNVALDAGSSGVAWDTGALFAGPLAATYRIQIVGHSSAVVYLDVTFDPSVNRQQGSAVLNLTDSSVDVLYNGPSAIGPGGTPQVSVSEIIPALAVIGGGGTFDVSDRAARLLGHVAVDSFGAGVDVTDRAARLLGHAVVQGTSGDVTSVANPADALGNGGTWLLALSGLWVWNGATYDKLREASAANLAVQSGIGAALVAPPGQWSVQHAPAVSLKATISKVAGGAGVRNVCTGFGFGFSAGTAVAAATVVVNLRDGATGAGTILRSWQFSLPATTIAPFAVEATGYEIPGSANTAMTLEFTALLTNLLQFVNLSGHLAS